MEDAEGRRKRKRRRILSMSDMVGMAAAAVATEERPWGNSQRPPESLCGTTNMYAEAVSARWKSQ